MAMQNSILLQQEIHRLHTSNKHQKEKKMTRAFIQDKGSLTGEEGLQRLRETRKRGHTRAIIIIIIIKILTTSTVQ
ncbi:uncharacterized protein ASPGLDRAFT_42420 [Aspergillus glaucus CBS 516.65]|uniref:Uncharacterized protein n=1 Tax=Aspergillus glaucus CBS 516.65 TaxID=1160497 RepID=A0A1L9VY23_ASPGL|nr:hypothetical protein ASPGLDRAFT_42420 [Aspergillus glaucus CBS 516.65]OJJ88820.1 hypothetical protein ASPGLDRAFT_42420 [Aspergillus glaucus CBS 516.65]